MASILAGIAGGVALTLAALTVAQGAPSGRPVPTETIILPSENDRVMPPIPGADLNGPGTGDVTPATPGAIDPDQEAIPEIQYDPAALPTPVRRLREQIIEAAKSGDPEKLRPIIDANDEPPDFSYSEDEDPIAALKSLSGDPEGREILAILLEVLEAGFVHVDVGTPDEMYIWPYFARYPLDKLTPPQLVELFKIVLAGDYEDMKDDGAYTSFRVGISPDGRWNYFLVSD